MTCSICRYEWCWLCGSTYSSTHFSNLNPFGCPGLQNGSAGTWVKGRIFLLRLGILLLFLIGVPVLIPALLIFGGPLLVGHLLWNWRYPDRWYQKFLVVFFALPLGLAVDPFVWIAGIFYFIPKGIHRLYLWCI